MSWSPSWTSWTNTPVGGPPLWNWPVELVALPVLDALVEHLVGRVLRLLDIRLVERVDAQRPAGDRRGELGEEEDLAEILRAVELRRDYRVPGLADVLKHVWPVGRAQL